MSIMNPIINPICQS